MNQTEYDRNNSDCLLNKSFEEYILTIKEAEYVKKENSFVYVFRHFFFRDGTNDKSGDGFKQVYFKYVM